MGAGSNRGTYPQPCDASAPAGSGSGNIRFGFRLSPDGKHVEPDPGEKGVLTEIGYLRQSGHTLQRIAASLNANRCALAVARPGGWNTWRRSSNRQAALAEDPFGGKLAPHR
jgi:hypothetical protein